MSERFGQVNRQVMRGTLVTARLIFIRCVPTDLVGRQQTAASNIAAVRIRTAIGLFFCMP
jgi:hypothetical protein